MSEDRKVSYQWYMAWEYDREEAVLDQKSREGWQLEKGGCFHSVFKKDEKACYRYRLDYHPEAMKTPMEKERYIAAFEDGGWEFVNSTFNGWIYLKKPYQQGMQEEEFEIYSDRESLMSMFERFYRLGQLLTALLLIVIALELGLAVTGTGAAGVVFAVFLLLILLWLRKGLRTLKVKQEMLADKQENEKKA